MLNDYLQIYGFENFREGLVVTYEKIVLTQEGNIESLILQDEFLKYLQQLGYPAFTSCQQKSRYTD